MICQKIERLEKKSDFFIGSQSFKNSMESGVKSVLIRQDSSFSKLLFLNNNDDKMSKSN